jgi:hypothetical protein
VLEIWPQPERRQTRRDGAHDVVDKYKDITVIQKVGDWDAAKGQQIATDVLTANPISTYLHSLRRVAPAPCDGSTGRYKRGEDSHII